MREYYGINDHIVKLENVAELDKPTCDELKCGDKVILVNGQDEEMFVIYKRQPDYIKMMSLDTDKIKKIVIKKTNEVWAKDSEAVLEPRAEVDENDEDVIIYNEGLEVDNNGDVTVGKDLYVEDELVIDSKEKFVDPDGNPIDFGGGSQHYKHAISLLLNGESILLNLITNGNSPIQSMSYLESCFIDSFVSSVINCENLDIIGISLYTHSFVVLNEQHQIELTDYQEAIIESDEVIAL